MAVHKYEFKVKLGGERCVKIFFNSIEVKTIDFASLWQVDCVALLKKLWNSSKKVSVVAIQKFWSIPRFTRRTFQDTRKTGLIVAHPIRFAKGISLIIAI